MATSLCVLATSSVPVGIRGALTQWLVEVLPGIFVGRPTARVRNWLWAQLGEALDDASYAALIHEDDCEQGFRIRRIGWHRYTVNDHDGIQLVTVEHQTDESQVLQTLLGMLDAR